MLRRFATESTKVAVRAGHYRAQTKHHGIGIGQTQQRLPLCVVDDNSFKPCWYSSTSRQLDNTTNTINSQDQGEEIYQQALQAMEKAKEIHEEREQEQSKQMFDAWQKSQEAEQDPKTQGVMVVKTLVKETRKAKKQQDATTKYLENNAMELLEQAANTHNHPMALIQLGNIALQDASKQKALEDSKENVLQAMDLFRRAGEAGSRVGWYNLGQLLWTGYPAGSDELVGEEDEDETLVVRKDQIVVPDLHEAMDIFTRAIDLGDTDAMYLVGVHRMTSGGRENIHSGLRLTERAADAGHGGALYYMALLNLNGEPNIGLAPCKLEEFVQHLDRAVNAGNVDALFTRGHSYYHGTEGYVQSHERALLDFLRAADEGHADSAVSAGAVLHAGIGVPKDQRRAFELYQLAGELGSKEGWQNVVACYTTGEGVPQSVETAKYIADTMLKDQ